MLHIDKGILYTTKELFTRPGHSIKEFLDGKRIKHFKPISLVLVLAGIYGFLCHYFEINILANNIEVQGSEQEYEQMKKVVQEMSEWISQHYSILSLIQIPIFTVGTYLGFKKVGYNFMEHLVINTFLSAQRLLLHIFTFPMYYFLNGTTALRTIEKIIDIAGYLLLMGSLIQFFNSLSIGQKIWRTLVSMSIILIIIVVLLMAVFKIFIASM